MPERSKETSISSTESRSSTRGAVAAPLLRCLPLLLCLIGFSATAAWGQHYAAPGGAGVAPCTDPAAPCRLALAVETATGVPGRTVFIRLKSAANPTASFTNGEAEDLTAALDADITFDAYLDAAQQGGIPGAVVTLAGDVGLLNNAHLTLGGLDLHLTGPTTLTMDENTAIVGPGTLVFAGTDAQTIMLTGAQNSIQRATIEKLKIRKEKGTTVEINEPSTTFLQVPDSLTLERGILATNGLLDANGTATVIINQDTQGQGILDAENADRAYISDHPEDNPFKVKYTGTQSHFTGYELPGRPGFPVDASIPVLEIAMDTPEATVTLGKDVMVSQELILTKGDFHVGSSHLTLENGLRITLDEGRLPTPAPLTRGRLFFPDVKETGMVGGDLLAGRDGIDLRYVGSTDRTVGIEWSTDQRFAIRDVTVAMNDPSPPSVQVALRPEETFRATNMVHLAREDDSFTLIGLDREGEVLSVDIVPPVVGPGEEIPNFFTLHGNYPNPFNPSTTIRLDLPETVDVTVEVFDVLGRPVLTLPAQRMKPGADQTIKLDASNLASGLYFYRVTAQTRNETHVRTGRMTLIR